MSEAPPEWKPEKFLDHARAREIPRALLQHRQVLGVGYAFVWVAFWLTELLFPRFIPALLRLDWSHLPRIEFTLTGIWSRLLVFLLFGGSQFAFLWAIAGTTRSPLPDSRWRREVSCGLSGLLATLCGFCVLLLFATVTIPDPLAPLLHACAAFLSGFGGAFAEWQKVPGRFFLLAAIVWAVASIAIWIFVRRHDPETAAWRLVAVMLITCVLAISIAVPLEIALTSQHNGGLGTLILAAPLLLWALGPSVYLLNFVTLRAKSRRHGTTATPADATEFEEALDATEYVSLARSYSIVLIAALYLAVDGCRSHLERSGTLDEARQAWATLHVQNTYSNAWTRNEPIETNSLVPAIGTVSVSTRFLTNYPAGMAVIQGPQPRASLDQAPEYRVLVKRTDGVQWRAVVSHQTETENARRSAQPDIPRDARSRLYGVFQSLWGGPPEGLEYDVMLGKIEYDQSDQSVPILGIELKFKLQTVPWVFSLVAMGFVIQIRNQVRRGLLDPTYGLAEPWLVLDGQRGLERGLAIVWLLAVAMAPWVANGCLLAFLGTNHAGGAIENPAFVLTRTLLALPVQVVGALISLSTCAEILRLRRLRLHRLNSIKERVETEMVFRGH